MYNIGILGATGIIGKKLISLLLNHPWFIIHSLGSSTKNIGKKYGDIYNIDPSINNIILKPCFPSFFSDCHFIFSCLDSKVSSDVEKLFKDLNFIIFSNCYNYRLHKNIPLVVPTVNSFLLKNTTSNIITNSNCSTTGIVTILKPLDIEFGVKNVIVTTLQAISGAGKYFDESINNNIIPFIQNEEEKISSESLKILEKNFSNFKISSTCNRVPVLNGHTICMSILFENKITPQQVITCLQNYNKHLINILNTPTSRNKQFIKIFTENNRPQPLLDTNNSNGFCISVGRIRKCNVFDINLTIHFDNTVIGAAGSTLLNAELYLKLKSLI